VQLERGGGRGGFTLWEVVEGKGEKEGQNSFSFVYYKSIKRELKRRPIYDCRCDERLKTNASDVREQTS
jgi:hypothetical protein